MATHVRKLNRYWSTMSATSCMSRWCRWFCQSLQYLGYLQCLSYLQRLRCLFKPPLSPLCMYNPIRSTSPSAVNSGQPAQSRSISEVVKQPGINLIPQRLTSVMDVTITELDIITRSAHHDLTTLLVVINFVFFLCWVISPGYIWIIVQLILWAKCCWSCKAFLYSWDLKTNIIIKIIFGYLSAGEWNFGHFFKKWRMLKDIGLNWSG